MPNEGKSTSRELVKKKKTIYRFRSLRKTHTLRHSRNPGGDSIKHLTNTELIVKTKRKPWPCLVMKLNFISIAWNFPGF